MKKLTFILGVILLFVGKTYAQEKVLIRYDMDAFEKIVRATDEYKSSSLYLPWAKEVFRAYSENKKVKVDFSEKDFQDAQKELKRLQNDMESLQKVKEKVETDLEGEKAIVETIKAEKQTLSDENKDLKKKLADLPGVEKQLEAKNKSIELLEGQKVNLNDQIDSQKKQLEECDAQLKLLAADTVSLGKEKRELQKQVAIVNGEKANLMVQLQEKDGQITSLNNTITELQKSNGNLTTRIQAYEAVFNNTKKTINDIYNANLSKAIIDMNPTQIDQAQNTYEGMKQLLAVDPVLSAELKRKVDEMNAWKALIEPLKGAKQYLRGKYDDIERQRWIAEISKVNVTGSKAGEKEVVLTLLRDQAKLYNEYKLFFVFLNERGCLPNNTELNTAKDKFDRMILYSKPYYHPSTYDGYDKAIIMIQEELNKTSPSKRVKTSSEFELFIADLQKNF